VILVDTSVWIAHFRAGLSPLKELLLEGLWIRCWGLPPKNYISHSCLPDIHALQITLKTSLI